MFLKQVHEKGYNARKYRGCFDLNTIEMMMIHADELQKAQTVKKKADLGYDPVQMKDLK